MNATLRRGATVRGRVIGPDGQPVQEARMFSRVILPSRPTGGWKIWEAREHGQVRNGCVRAAWTGRGRRRPRLFSRARAQAWRDRPSSPANQSLDGPVTVRLEPCGMAQARLVAPAENRSRVMTARGTIALVVTPGPFEPSDRERWPAGWRSSHPGLDRPDQLRERHHVRRPGPDHLPCPDPGAPYHFARLSREFTVKPGEILELGDILIQVPRR